MFDFVERHKKVIQVFLALIALTFMTWGIESYTRVRGANDAIAVVDDAKITEREFSEQLRRQQERLRAMFGRNFDLATLDSAETRTALLESMIGQRLVASEAVRAKLTVTNEALAEAILSIPDFQAGGKFSREHYEAVLRAQGQTPASFESSVRYDMLVGNLTRSLTETAIQPRAVAERLASLESQKREVQEAIVPAAQFAGEVKVDEARVKAYYDANQAEFRLPERVRVEYVVLSAQALGAAESVSEEELKKAYEDRMKSGLFKVDEQRRASHILVAVPAGAKPEEREAAKKKATEILAEARKAPARFAELAKKHSQDTGSADKGGELGLFGRGQMVKAFDEAVFTGKAGDILGPVETEYGYHVLRIDGIEAGKAKPLEEVRKELSADIVKQRALKKFTDSAEAFTNIVYEQADGLKPAADKFGLKLQTSDWIAQKPGPTAGLLGNPKLLAALFSSDSLKTKRNTDAIEVAPNTLVSARVLEHQPSSVRPLDSAKAEIEQKLVRAEAAKLAQKDGQAKLDKLQKGEDAGVKWTAAKFVSRRAPEGVPPDALARVLAVDAAKLPAHVGLQTGDGFALYRVSKVLPPDPRPEDQQKAELANAARQLGTEQHNAYIDAIRARSKVEINKALLEKK